jgi:hypothetical protein
MASSPSIGTNITVTQALDHQTRALLSALDKRFEARDSKWDFRVAALESRVADSKRVTFLRTTAVGEKTLDTSFVREDRGKAPMMSLAGIDDARRFEICARKVHDVGALESRSPISEFMGPNLQSAIQEHTKILGEISARLAAQEARWQGRESIIAHHSTSIHDLEVAVATAPSATLRAEQDIQVTATHEWLDVVADDWGGLFGRGVDSDEQLFEESIIADNWGADARREVALAACATGIFDGGATFATTSEKHMASAASPSPFSSPTISPAARVAVKDRTTSYSPNKCSTKCVSHQPAHWSAEFLDMAAADTPGAEAAPSLLRMTEKAPEDMQHGLWHTVVDAVKRCQRPVSLADSTGTLDAAMATKVSQMVVPSPAGKATPTGSSPESTTCWFSCDTKSNSLNLQGRFCISRICWFEEFVALGPATVGKLADLYLSEVHGCLADKEQMKIGKGLLECCKHLVRNDEWVCTIGSLYLASTMLLATTAEEDLRKLCGDQLVVTGMGAGHSLIGPDIGAGIGLVGQGNFSIFSWDPGDHGLVTSGLGAVSVWQGNFSIFVWDPGDRAGTLTGSGAVPVLQELLLQCQEHTQGDIKADMMLMIGYICGSSSMANRCSRDSYDASTQDSASKAISYREASNVFTWFGAPWHCQQRLKHYKFFCCRRIPISVHSLYTS